MAHSNDEKVNALWEAYSQRSTVHTIIKAQTYQLMGGKLETPKGNHELLFQAGDKVITTGNGAMKKDIHLTVEKSELANGHARYYCGGMWHLQGDLKNAA